MIDCFAKHGIPSMVRNANGPQFNPLKNGEFIEFKNKFKFDHITQSFHYPKTNGFIEVIMKAMKLDLAKTGDMLIFSKEQEGGRNKEEQEQEQGRGRGRGEIKRLSL